MVQVLVVEDEAILRKGIISLINWQALGCEIAGDVPNGQLALELVRQKKIDLVVTDIKMPVMTGLELARELDKSHPEIGVIILSAYSDFSFARQAIQYNVLNYVLKSDFVNELPLAVESAVFTLGQKESANREGLGVDDERLARILFQSLLEGNLREIEPLEHLFKRLRLDCPGYYLLLAELDPREYSEFEGPAAPPDAAAENFLGLALQEYPHFCYTLSPVSIAVLVGSGAPEDDADTLCRLVLKCNEILSTAQNYMSFDLNMGLSAAFVGLRALPDAYRQAKAALGAIGGAASLSVYEQGGLRDEPEGLPDVNAFAERLLHAAAAQNREAAQDVLAELFAAHELARTGHDKIRMELLLLFSQIHLNHAKHGLCIPGAEGIMQAGFGELCGAFSIHALKKAALAFAEGILASGIPSAQSQNPLVRQVNRYIAERYHTNIKLDQLADHLHVSSSYLSRMYKKKTGLSIITYLNSYRVERAKELFAGGQLTVSDVGYRVGFDNPAYFTHVFTKYTGQSPTAYCRALSGPGGL